MVKYHKNGKVVVAHEEYLEQEARRIADIPNNGYTEQILLATYPFDSRTSEVEVRIIVDHQYFRTLYATDRDTEHLGEEIKEFSASEESGEPECPLEGSIHKATFMRCSTLANDFFRGEPTALALHLPVTYPRVHLSGSWEDFKRNCLTNSSGNQPIAPLVAGKKYFNRYDDQMAYIRRDEIEQFIFPWLKAMEPVVRAKDDTTSQSWKYAQSDLPRIEIPTELEAKIHLYNATLQLGLPRFVQQPLIDALVLQMYKVKLLDCHLETLEMTIARFYGNGVAVLDPVINHLIGTYAFRTVSDRKNPGAVPESATRPMGDDNASTSNSTNVGSEVEKPSTYKNLNSRRRLLEYSSQNGLRTQHVNDTFIVAPYLPVLGHSIRHWSGIRANGSTAAAHTGYPLNVGKYKKYFRRHATATLGDRKSGTGFEDDFVEYSTYRLNQSVKSQEGETDGDPVRYYRNQAAGQNNT